MRPTDYAVGERFGNLTIEKIFYSPIGKQGRVVKKVDCVCDCGGKTTTMITKLRSGHTKTCGCLHKKVITAHGKYKSLEYHAWHGMKQRCFNRKNKRFKDYGGRGIGVCKEWLSFGGFYSDMGDKPTGTSLDRVDNSKGYCKDNCRWATRREQQNNMRSNHFLKIGGKEVTLSCLARERKLEVGTLYPRIKRGWNTERALTTPGRK